MALQYPGSLHDHTDYSNLRLRDATTTVESLMDRAIELGQTVLAYTEHETVANAIRIEKYYNKVKKDHPDFKVIRGNEIYLCRDGLNGQSFIRGQDKYYHFILLAKDTEGHEQIRELSTRAWMRSYSAQGLTRVPTYYSDLIEVIGNNRGHVIGSTACVGGWLGQTLYQYEKESHDSQIWQHINDWLNSMIKLFGEGNFFLEMQPGTSEIQKITNKYILQLSVQLNIPYIITCDTHYLRAEDRPIHEAFLKSQSGDRETSDFYESTYLMETNEIEQRMSDYMTADDFQYAYQNIIDIANMCEDYSLLKPLHIPSMPWKKPKGLNIDWNFYEAKIPYMKTFHESAFDGDRLLAQIVCEKIESDSRLQTDEIYNEVNENLESTWISSEVNKTHWSAYFLNLQGYIDVCWDAGSLVGPGRGSGVGFILLYLLDIIQINPKWETTPTYSWRFLNPNRVSVLDIDTDIEGGRRPQVLQALRDTYGQDRVANVVTFGTEKSKSAIQTAARGLGIDIDESLYVASLIPSDRGITRTLKQCYYGDAENGFEPIPAFVTEMDENPDLWKVAQNIEGLISRVGEHAGGVIFVDEPFTKSTALMKVPNGDVVTQFDLHDCEDVSLIKIDLLSVECLDKIHSCLDLLIQDGQIKPEATLRETYEKYLGIYNIERKDSKMWDMVQHHEIQSLFQWEKQSGIQGIELTHPRSVDDLAVLNSIIRLMAQDDDEISPLQKYTNFKNDISLWYKEMTQWGLSKDEQKILEPIVKSSYGIAESQEKIMKLVQLPECGGFNLTWADKLRKSIAKKNPAQYQELEKEYFQNVEDKHLSKSLCTYVWRVLIAMSRGYSFNALLWRS